MPVRVDQPTVLWNLQGTLKDSYKDVTQTNVFKLSNILCYVTVRKAFRGKVGQLQRKLGGHPSQYLLGKILYTMQTELIENLTCVGLRKTI